MNVRVPRCTCYFTSVRVTAVFEQELNCLESRLNTHARAHARTHGHIPCTYAGTLTCNASAVHIRTHTVHVHSSTHTHTHTHTHTQA